MSNRQRFIDKVVIITGSAQGIGRGVALQVAAEGGQVVMADRSEYVEDVLKEIRNAGGDAVTINADL
ncbi:SDR family NAD(P)-dependent oxidoreductase, partial [Acinetobacter baumannii]